MRAHKRFADEHFTRAHFPLPSVYVFGTWRTTKFFMDVRLPGGNLFFDITLPRQHLRFVFFAEQFADSSHFTFLIAHEVFIANLVKGAGIRRLFPTFTIPHRHEPFVRVLMQPATGPATSLKRLGDVTPIANDMNEFRAGKEVRKLRHELDVSRCLVSPASFTAPLQMFEVHPFDDVAEEGRS